MALKKKPVTGMKDVMPAEMEIRDYLIGLIKDTYKTFGFQSMETPCVEHIENLCSKQGGDNEKLIFKILIMQMSCRLLLKHFRLEVYGEQTARRKDVSASLCSAISIY